MRMSEAQELVSPILEMFFRALLVSSVLTLSSSQTEPRDRELNLLILGNHGKHTEEVVRKRSECNLNEIYKHSQFSLPHSPVQLPSIICIVLFFLNMLPTLYLNTENKMIHKKFV